MSGVDVHVFRESVARVVRALTDSKIVVRQQGMKAFVSYDINGKPASVTLPSIPDNAPADLLNAIQGFLDHEVSHVLHTDFAYAAKNQRACKIARDKVRPVLWNIIEDVFVEAAMVKRFTGSMVNIDNIQRYVTGKMLTEGFAQMKANDATDTQMRSFLMPAAVRAAAGQPAFVDFMSDKWSHMGYTEEGIKAMGAKFKTIKSTQEAWDLTEKLYEVVSRPPSANPDVDPEPGDGEGDGKNTGTKAPETESKENKPSDEPEAGDEEDDGEEAPPPAADPADEEAEKPSAPEPAEKPAAEPADEEAPADESDKPEGDKPEKPENETDSGTGEHEQDEEEGNASDAEDGDGSSGDDEESEDEEGESESSSTQDEDDGEESESQPSSLDEPDEPASSGKDEASKGEGNPAGSEPTDDDDTPANIEDLIDPDLVRPLEDVASDMIEKAIAEHMASNPSDYVPFSRDYDYVGPLPAADEFQERSLDESHVAKAAAESSHVIQGEVERIFRARSASRWNPGQRRGKVNRNALHKACIGDDRVFRTKIEAQNRDVAVQLVMDLSGSMSGSKIEYACTAAYMLATVLERINVSCEIVGFTTLSAPIAKHAGVHDWKQMKREMEEVVYDSDAKHKFARFAPIALYTIKEFAKRFDDVAKKTLGFLSTAYGFMFNNVDGESIEVAAMRLQQRREARKVMIVMSDGQPACDGKREKQQTKLKQVVEDIARSGMEIYGLGLMDDAVQGYYPKCEVIHTAEEIPTKVLALIQKLLTS